MTDPVQQELPTKRKYYHDGNSKKKWKATADSGQTTTDNIPLEGTSSSRQDLASTTKNAAGTSDEKFRNSINPEELNQLRQFHVIDEVKSNDEENHEEHSDDPDGKFEDLPEDEIEQMLEADLPENLKGASNTRERPFTIRQKIVLEEKGVDHLEVLPVDWIVVPHACGMPVYMHRATRVCTLSKPYYLGQNNPRHHDIPISAIPCFAYKKALEEEEKQKDIDNRIEEQIRDGTWANNIDNETNNNVPNAAAGKGTASSVPYGTVYSIPCVTKEKGGANGAAKEPKVYRGNTENIEEIVLSPMSQCPFSGKTNITTTVEEDGRNDKGDEQTDTTNKQPVLLPGSIPMPPPRVETVTSSWQSQHLSAEQITDYCRNLFKFKTVNVMHFKRWADRRKYTNARKTLQYPTLPGGRKLITIPTQSAASGQQYGGKPSKRDWVVNMNDRSYLSVFHEYVKKTLQTQPVYTFKQLENASQPYQATVHIGAMQYGVGYGCSKRQAKSAAARASIHILIPEMKDNLDSADPRNYADQQPDCHDFFDSVGIEDPRVPELCAATAEHSPHAILRTCLLRNFGADRHVHTEMKKLECQKIEVTLKVGKHTASAVCNNKKTAKQRASQAILQALHPHVRSWGSLLRLYGSKSVQSCKEKKLEEREITSLQDKGRRNEPNYAVLEKLRQEMRKLRERDQAVTPIGTLVLKDDLPTHSGSNLNNVDL